MKIWLSLLGEKFRGFPPKNIVGDVPTALLVKERQAILDTSNFLITGILPYLRLVRFLSPAALRLTLHGFSPCLVPALPV